MRLKLLPAALISVGNKMDNPSTAKLLIYMAKWFVHFLKNWV